MKAKKFFSVVLIFVLALIVTLTSEAQAKPRLTVRQFENKTGERSVPAAAITDMMVTELGEAGIFNLLERERLDYVTDELALAQSGLMDSATAPQIGKLKGAEYTMTGAVTLYHYTTRGGAIGLAVIGGVAAAKTAYVTLDIRIIDNTTGEIVYTNVEEGRATREIAGGAGGYRGFFVGGGQATYGGILAAATRDAVIKHVNRMSSYDWD